MAAFFANVQVHTRDRAAVIEAITHLLSRAGFTPEAESFGGERSLYVGPADNGWVAVYDSACDGVAVGPLAWLAQGLSAELATVTLAWYVHDSALLLYLLFANGEVADRYLSQPDRFAPERTAPATGSRRQAPLGGNGARLLGLTGIEGDATAISRWLRRPDQFVQRTLRRVAGALGQRYAELGHAELEADLLAEAHLEDPRAFERLEFARPEA